LNSKDVFFDKTLTNSSVTKSGSRLEKALFL
jgi:hypothetical protein